MNWIANLIENSQKLELGWPSLGQMSTADPYKDSVLLGFTPGSRRSHSKGEVGIIWFLPQLQKCLKECVCI